MKSLTIVIIVLCAVSTIACGTVAVQAPAAPSSEASQAFETEPETVEVTVYDREGLDALTETLDWAGYEMVPGYPQKLRFGEGWLVLARR